MLWDGLRRIGGISPFYYQLSYNRIATAPVPGMPSLLVTGREFLWAHMNTKRFYVLVGVRPHRHLLVVRECTSGGFAKAQEFVKEQLV